MGKILTSSEFSTGSPSQLDSFSSTNLTKKILFSLIDSFLSVLGGPPDELIYSGDKTYMTTSACRHQSCTEKGFVFIDTEKKFTIGLIRHFFINDDKNEKSFDEGDFLIFSHLIWNTQECGSCLPES